MPAKNGSASADAGSLSPEIRIAGLDTGGLLSRVCNDRPLMLRILRHFAETQKRTADALPSLVESDPQTARSTVHELRGTLGNIGANDIFERAAALSLALRESRPEDARKLAGRISEDIRELCGAIDAAVPAPARAETRAGAGTASTSLNTLISHLKSGRAREVHRTIDRLHDVALAPEQRRLLEQVAPLVAAYRFREALRLLGTNPENG